MIRQNINDELQIIRSQNLEICLSAIKMVVFQINCFSEHKMNEFVPNRAKNREIVQNMLAHVFETKTQ